MLELRKFVAPEFVFGAGAIDLVARYARNFGGRRILVVTDPGVIEAGWAEKVLRTLADEDLAAVVFSEVSANPRAEEVMIGADLYREQGCDVIVAVGGGSPMDCAKGIAIVSTNHADILEFEGIDNVDAPGPPLICIPTTAGTSADVSQFAIISDQRAKVKRAIVSKTTVPDVALIDPLTTLTMDPHLTACTGMDALVHAIEAYVSTASAPLFDLHALEAIRLIAGNLERVMADPGDAEARGRIMLASLEAGLAFSNASLGAVHAMAHSLGGYLDMPHGECNAILLAHVMAFNYPEATQKYDNIGRAMGLANLGESAVENRRLVLEEIRRLTRAVGITRTLGDHGVRAADLANLAGNAMQDACMVTNPRVPVQGDIETVYAEAL
jgi:alcohol dehydrogenase class IV